MFVRRFIATSVLIISTLPTRADDVRDLIGKAGTTRGICMIVGDAGPLAADLAKQTELTIFVQLGSAKEADTLRRSLDDAGLLGRRVYVQQGDFKRLHLADDLADVVAIHKSAIVADAEALRVLRPEGKLIAGDKVQTKPFRAGSDEWSHPYRGPDNNPQSADANLKRPFLTHFMAEPWYCPLPMQSVISGGRIFKVFGDRSSAKPQEPLINKLIAMNAFNGTILWQRDLSPGFMIHRNTLIATPDTLYLGDDKACHFLDPVTGKVRDSFVVPAEKSDGPVWKWMAYENGVIVALVGEKEASDEPLKGERIRGAGWPWWKIADYKFGHGKNLIAVDPKTKKLLWHHKEDETIDARGMALKSGRLYFHSEGKFLACLDTKSGQLLWRNASKELMEAVGDTKKAQHPILGFASTAYLKCSDDAVFFAGPNRPMLVAASAKDGKLLWKKDCSVADGTYPTEGGNVQLVIRPEGLYALGQGRINGLQSSYKLEPLTGQVLATFPSRDRCTRATGCADSIFTRGGKGGSTAVFDVSSQEPRMGVLSPMRPACQDGVTSAHGYLFWGPWQCRCDMTQLGVISLGSAGGFAFDGKARDEERLVKSAINLTGRKSLVTDWPTYRRDNHRSGVTTHQTPDKVGLQWTYIPKAPTLPAAPIADNGLIYTSAMDGTIRALDAASGKVSWTTYTGGPIRYPPTVANGRLYVGSGDGYIYNFAATTGTQLWRFRTAPIQRVIPLYGSLSSTWPVGSGVIVENGTVIGASGISNFDGSHVFGLDAISGNIRWQQHFSSYTDGELPSGGVSVQGPLLSHDGKIHMASGNTPPIATFALADGKYEGSTNGRGKDLFVRAGKVFGTGFPLYWRPEDDQFLSTMELECPAGVLHVGIPPTDPTAPNKFELFPPHEPGQKVAPLWNSKMFQEVSAVAFTKNAIIVTGVNREPKNPQKYEAALAALSLVDGKPLWKQELPGHPTAWGLAIDREGRMIVTLMDGRVLAFGN